MGRETAPTWACETHRLMLGGAVLLALSAQVTDGARVAELRRKLARWVAACPACRQLEEEAAACPR